MIRESHLGLLVDRFIRTSWSNPSLETNITIVPTLLNVKYPSYGTVRVMRSNYILPKANVGYDVYSLEHVPAEVFRQGVQSVGSWMNFTEFCTKNNLLLYTSYADDLYTGAFSESYIMYLQNRTLIIAVPTVRRNLRDKLSLYIRTSNDTFNTDIDVEEWVLSSQTEINNWVASDQADINRAMHQYHLNGVYVSDVNSANLKPGDRVSKIVDTSTKYRSDTLLDSLEVYTKDQVNFYLVTLSTDSTNNIYSRFDSVMYLINQGEGKRILLNKEDIVQLTDNEVGLRVGLIESILSTFGWLISDTTLRVYTKEGIPPQHFVNNDNFWYSLQRLPADLRRRALIGSISAPEFIYARSYHGNKFNLAMDLEYEDLTTQALNDFLPVATWDYQVNRSVVPAELYNNNFTDLISVPNNSKVMMNYIDGYVDKFKPGTKPEGSSHLSIGYSVETEIRSGHSMPVTDMMVPAIYSRINDEFTLLKEGDDYAIIDGKFEVKIQFKEVHGLDLATSFMTDLPLDKRIIDLPLAPVIYGMGYISLIGDDRTLIPGIDFSTHYGKLILNYGKEVERLKFIFQPVIDPQSVVVETGFTRNGSLSVNGSYLELDPDNHYFIVGGKVLFPRDIEWDVPYVHSQSSFDNALPYAVMKVLLTNSDGDNASVQSKRREYDDQLTQMANFKDVNVELPELPVSTYPESYRLVSIFMYEVLQAVYRGEIKVDPTTVGAIGVEGLVTDYLYLLDEGKDITTQDLEWNIIELRAHGSEAPLTVTSDQYNFLDKVNHKYLGGRIYLNTNFRISI